jgi:hypothetical protein
VAALGGRFASRLRRAAGISGRVMGKQEVMYLFVVGSPCSGLAEF